MAAREPRWHTLGPAGGVALIGAAIGALVLMVFALAVAGPAVFELVNLFNFRSLHTGVLEVPLFSNLALIAAAAASLLLQAAAVYAPPLQAAFGTVPLGGTDWLLLLLCGIPFLLQGEDSRQAFGPGE